jgi:hypothetical protein
MQITDVLMFSEKYFMEYGTAAGLLAAYVLFGDSAAFRKQSCAFLLHRR